MEKVLFLKNILIQSLINLNIENFFIKEHLSYLS
jgi:hypothetical protein